MAEAIRTVQQRNAAWLRPGATGPTPNRIPQPASEKVGPLVVLLGLYALLLTVPVAEIVARLGARTFAPLIVGTVLSAGVFTTGRVGEFWKLPVARPYMLFLVLALLAGAAGSYPSRSLQLLLSYGLRMHVVPFFCCAIAVTTRQVRHVFSWVGLGALLLLVLCAQFGEMVDDRLIVKGSSLENPNDLGFAIVYSMTGLLVFRSIGARVISLVMLPVFLLFILKTGSRANLLTLIALALIACFYAPAKWRVALLLGLPVIAAGVLAVVPGETRARLLSVFGGGSGVVSDEVTRAGDSKAARAQLQLRAIELAVRHPLLGVGVTNFEDAVDDMIQATLHVKSGWQVAHNTYLQIAAENGYPAFICYVWCLVASFRMSYRSYKITRSTPGLSHATAQSFGLMMMTAMFIVCTAFSNNSFDPRLNLLVGLNAANYLAIQRESEASQGNAASPQASAGRRWQPPLRPGLPSNRRPAGGTRWRSVVTAAPLAFGIAILTR